METTDNIFKDGLFAGQRVLVTGGGTGLGFAMAEQLAALGAELHLCGRRASVLEEAAQRLRTRFGITVGTHVLDIRSPQAVDDMMETIWTRHGPLDSLVNNAAGNFISRTEDLSPNGFHAISDIVFRGTFYATQAAGKRWIAAGRVGSVLSIVVTWVATGAPFVVPSAMSKAGIDVMTKSLAVEWGPKGIRLNAIAPGVIPTAGASGRLRPVDSQENAWPGRTPRAASAMAATSAGSPPSCWRRRTAGSTARPSPSTAPTRSPTAPISPSTRNGTTPTGWPRARRSRP